MFSDAMTKNIPAAARTAVAEAQKALNEGADPRRRSPIWRRGRSGLREDDPGGHLLIRRRSWRRACPEPTAEHGRSSSPIWSRSARRPRGQPRSRKPGTGPEGHRLPDGSAKRSTDAAVKTLGQAFLPIINQVIGLPAIVQGIADWAKGTRTSSERCAANCRRDAVRSAGCSRSQPYCRCSACSSRQSRSRSAGW